MTGGQVLAGSAADEETINGVTFDPCATIAFGDLAGEEIGRRAGLLWPNETLSPRPTLFANRLAHQFGSWSPMYYARWNNAPRSVPPIEVRAIPGASVLGGSGAARLPDGRIIDLWLRFRTVTNGGPLAMLKGGVLGARRDPVRPHFGGAYLLGHVGGDENYAHWVTCCLPIWRYFARNLRESGLKLVLGDLKEFHRGALDILGIGPERIFAMPDREVSFSELIVTTPIMLSPPSRVVAAAAGDVRERVLAARPFTQGPGGGTGRRLFVSRADSGSRRLLNEAKVVTTLEAFGFERILCGEMTFADQVRAFAGADIVVGVHGAALANIAFCRPGTPVIELMPEYCVQPAYRDLATICGLPHGLVTGTTLERVRSRLEKNSWAQPFVVGVPLVVDAVRAALSVLRDARTTPALVAADSHRL